MQGLNKKLLIQVVYDIKTRKIAVFHPSFDIIAVISSTQDTFIYVNHPIILLLSPYISYFAHFFCRRPPLKYLENFREKFEQKVTWRNVTSYILTNSLSCSLLCFHSLFTTRNLFSLRYAISWKKK